MYLLIHQFHKNNFINQIPLMWIFSLKKKWVALIPGFLFKLRYIIYQLTGLVCLHINCKEPWSKYTQIVLQWTCIYKLNSALLTITDGLQVISNNPLICLITHPLNCKLMLIAYAWYKLCDLIILLLHTLILISGSLA